MNEERKCEPSSSKRSARRDALHRDADARLKERLSGVGPKGEVSRDDLEKLLYELHVREAELETANAELEEAKAKASAALRKFSDLYDHAPMGYFTLDEAGAIRDVNASGVELMGMSGSTLVGRSFSEFVSSVDRPAFDAFLKKVFETRTQNACETRLVKVGGRMFEADLEAIVSGTEDTCRLAILDVTERKRVAKDRLVMSKLESTGILAGGIAHDFNNLLTVILLNLNMARMIAPARKKLVAHLEQAEETALRARNLTQQLLTFAEGSSPLRRPISLVDVIREGVRGALSGSRVLSEFSLSKDLWPIEVDKGQIGQAVRNLVLNAREAMPRGGTLSVHAENVVLDAGQEVSLPAGEYVRVSIADRGGGIPADLVPKIFDPYFSTKTRGEQKGMGLGLTICHSIVQKHGGAITVESREGEGSVFHVYLPATPTKIEKDKQASTAVSGGSLKILVMDDEEWVREVLGVTIREMGHEVELAKDGGTAREAYIEAKDSAVPFDGVLLDLTVRAGMGGKEAVRTLLEVDPDLKAIIMSGYENDPVIQEYRRYGFKGALIKPFSIEELGETLIQVVDP